MKLSIKLTLLLCFLLSSGRALGESKIFRLYFRINETKVEAAYMGNAKTLEALRNIYSSMSEYEKPRAILNVSCYNSVEGNEQFNQMLWHQPYQELKKVLGQLMPKVLITENKYGSIYDLSLLQTLLDKGNIQPRPDCPDVEDKNCLKNYVEEYLGNSSLRSVLAETRYVEIKIHIPNESDSERQTLRELCPEELGKRIDFLSLPKAKSDELEFVEHRFHSVNKPKVKSKDNALPLRLKTNLLLDLALVPNLGVEYLISPDYSIQASWMYAWWSKDSKHYYWRIYGGDLEFRRWLGNSTNQVSEPRHAIGVYAQMMTFDFELGKYGIMAEKWLKGGGLSYTYLHPLSKRFSLEANIGLGFLWGNIYRYRPCETCYTSYRQTHTKWLGPTKVALSLVWNISK